MASSVIFGVVARTRGVHLYNGPRLTDMYTQGAYAILSQSMACYNYPAIDPSWLSFHVNKFVWHQLWGTSGPSEMSVSHIHIPVDGLNGTWSWAGALGRAVRCFGLWVHTDMFFDTFSKNGYIYP